MCGRFTIAEEMEIVRRRFSLSGIEDLIMPRYNIAPGQLVSVLLWDNGFVARPMKWGLIPSWAKDPSIGNRMINARAETIHEKPSFKRLLKSKRCLVIADGFYEWRVIADTKKKIPMRIVLKSREAFAFAGLWDRWHAPEGEEVETFTIITTEANEFMKPFHHRMPVIFVREDEERWLDPSLKEPEELLPLLKQYPSELMDAYDVSTVVNSPKNEVPICIERAKSA